MCTRIMVCHGNKAETFQEIYANHAVKHPPGDCTPATYYITNDGNYALDADFVSPDELDNVDLNNVPKIPLK